MPCTPTLDQQRSEISHPDQLLAGLQYLPAQRNRIKPPGEPGFKQPVVKIETVHIDSHPLRYLHHRLDNSPIPKLYLPLLLQHNVTPGSVNIPGPTNPAAAGFVLFRTGPKEYPHLQPQGTRGRNGAAPKPTRENSKFFTAPRTDLTSRPQPVLY